MKSSRLFEIVYRLLKNGCCTAPQLARDLEVSVRTIYRDIDALCQAGVPVVTEQGQKGGIRLMDDWLLDKALMDPSEQEQLLMAVKSFAALQEDSGELALKLGALFRRQPRDWLRVDFHYWGPVNENDERFEIIKTAVLEKRILSFQYAAYNGMTERRVKPVLLYFKGNAWYLQAFCLMRNEFRTFKLSRVSQLSLTEELFDEELAPPPIDPWEWAFEWPEVHLQFAPYMAYRVYDDYDEECVHVADDGSLLVTTHMPPEDEWSAGRILSYGTGVTVISPEKLRLTVADYAFKLYQYYQSQTEP